MARASLLGALAFGIFGFYNNFISSCFFALGWKFCVRPDMSNRYQISTLAGLALFSFLGSCFTVEKLRKVINLGKE